MFFNNVLYLHFPDPLPTTKPLLPPTHLPLVSSSSSAPAPLSPRSPLSQPPALSSPSTVRPALSSFAQPQPYSPPSASPATTPKTPTPSVPTSPVVKEYRKVNYKPFTPSANNDPSGDASSVALSPSAKFSQTSPKPFRRGTAPTTTTLQKPTSLNENTSSGRNSNNAAEAASSATDHLFSEIQDLMDSFHSEEREMNKRNNSSSNNGTDGGKLIADSEIIVPKQVRKLNVNNNSNVSSCKVSELLEPTHLVCSQGRSLISHNANTSDTLNP